MPSYIPGVGPISPLFAFVGDAPETQDEIKNQPLTASSGDVLNSLLRSTGVLTALSKDDQYIERAEKIYITTMSKYPGRYGTLTRYSDDDYEDLIDELSGLNTKVILLAGVNVLRAFCSKTNIHDWRGSPLTSPDLPGKILIPCFHPAYILHTGQFILRQHLMMDISKAVRLAGGATIPEPQITVNPTADQALAFLDKVWATPLYAYDIETKYQRVTCISFAISPTEAMTIPVDDGYWSKADYETVLPYMWRVLQTAPGKQVLHNCNYDTYMLKRFYDVQPQYDKICDTMIAHSIIHPDLPKSLKLLSSFYTYFEFFKGDLNAARRDDDFTLEQTYCAKDSISTLIIWNAIQGQLAAGHIPTYDFTLSCLPLIQQMQDSGLRPDKPGLARERKQLVSEIATLESSLDQLVYPTLCKALDPQVKELESLVLLREQIKSDKKLLTQLKKLTDAKITAKEFEQRMKLTSSALDTKPLTVQITKLRTRLKQWQDDSGRFHLNVNAPDKCVEYFYTMRGISPYYATRKNSKGQRVKTMTVDDNALVKMCKPTLYRPEIPEAKILQDLRERGKIVSTYIDIQFDDDGRYRCSWNLRGTKFGRWSSDKLFFVVGGNQQNNPPRIRRYYLPDSDTKSRIYFFGEYDGSQAEWVIVAYDAEEPNMIQCLVDKKDPHTYTASLISNVSEKSILAENSAVKKETNPARIESLRENLGNQEIQTAAWKPRNRSYRQAGKKANHALNYREGPGVYADQNEISIVEAKREIGLYTNAAYPGLKSWWKRIEADVRTTRKLTNLWGRVITFLGPVYGKHSDKVFKEATAAIPQSTVVDLVNRAFKSTVDVLGCNVTPKSQNHDSFLLQHHIDLTQTLDHNIDRILSEILVVKTNMEQPMVLHGREFIIDSDATFGRNWAEKSDTNPDGLRGVAYTREAVAEYINTLLKQTRKVCKHV